MFWLRAIFFSSPLWLVFGGSWLFDEVGEMLLSEESDAFVYAIREPVGLLSPLVPSSGITGEVTDLVFEPLFSRDENLNLVPNLVERWSEQTIVTIRCSSEEAAGEGEAMLRSGEYLDEATEMLALDRSESVLTLALRGADGEMVSRLLDRFSPGSLGDYLLVKLTVKHSVRGSVESFLAAAVEKTQVRMVDYDGDREASLFVKGDTELFLKELNLYYASNSGLEPQIEVLGKQCHTEAREMLLDLRTDVKWHDGRAFTAEDVLYSYQLLTSPDSPLPLAASFWFVEGLEAAGASDTGRVQRFARYHAGELGEAACPACPSAEGAFCWGDRDLFFAAPVGNGPYRFAGRRGDGGVELVANEDHFHAVPLEKRLRYRSVNSLEAVLLALRSSSLDAIVPDERFADWSLRNPGLVEQVRCQPRFQHVVAWNLAREPLSKQSVRRALAAAIDLKQVLRDSPTGFEAAVDGLFPAGVPYCDEEMRLPLYDPRGAERLLEKEGYRLDEATGVLVGSDGHELSFTLAVNRANPEHRRMAESLAEQWAGIGVRVKLEWLAWENLVAGRLIPREFDAAMLSWELPYERDRYALWHSSGIGQGGGNFSGLRDGGVDSLLEKIRYEADPAKLKALTAGLQKAIADLQPCFFVAESGRILTLRTGGVKVARPLPDGTRTVEPLAGMAGFREARPWWVRQETLNRQLPGDAAGD